MSFNRLNYDTCSYQHSLAESVGPGEYMLTEPPNVTKSCFPQSPQIRLQRQGVSVSQNMPLIDVDSELMNLTRPATNCPSRKYVPNGNQCNENNRIEEAKNNLEHGEDCFFPVEDTRLSNPACNLRGTGWNRWEWLCLDPQERVLMPFDYNINNRLVVKDNHRPCIPKPLDVSMSLPPSSENPRTNNIVSTCGVPTGPPSIQWQNSLNAKQV
tara:strand:- start:2839 stop:3474 length:636 start_codon:yes stop_codon:yes gene_type:complete